MLGSALCILKSPEIVVAPPTLTLSKFVWPSTSMSLNVDTPKVCCELPYESTENKTALSLFLSKAKVLGPVLLIKLKEWLLP